MDLFWGLILSAVSFIAGCLFAVRVMCEEPTVSPARRRNERL